MAKSKKFAPVDATTTPRFADVATFMRTVRHEISEEIDIGLLLPCNVIVYENPTDQKTVVAAIDPGTMLQVTGRDDMAAFADEVRQKLTNAIESMG